MDLKVGLNGTPEPYALVFYRANERAVLDTLYKADTVDSIVAALKGLPAADAIFGPNRWKDLVNVVNLDADHGFPNTRRTVSGFRFPTMTAMPSRKRFPFPGLSSNPSTERSGPGIRASCFPWEAGR
jgi:hypothetical protein